MRWAAAGLVLAACSFDHGLSTAPDAACTRTSGTPWWNPLLSIRYRIDTGGAPTGYTIALDDTPLRGYFWGDGDARVQVVVDHTTAIDRVFEDDRMFVKIPAEGQLWVYAPSGLDDVATLGNRNQVFEFAESFDTAAGLDRFDLQPPADWSRVDYPSGWSSPEWALRVTGPGRHPGAIKNLAIDDGEITASVRFLAGTGQQHNGLAVRSKSMMPATMDGFVGQVQADVQHARIAEYTDGVSPPAELVTMNRMLDRNRWYRLKLRFVGDTLTLSIDGQVALTTTKAGWDGNLLGLFAHDCDVEFDDVRVRHVIDPEPVVTLGPREDYCD